MTDLFDVHKFGGVDDAADWKCACGAPLAHLVDRAEALNRHRGEVALALVQRLSAAWTLGIGPQVVEQEPVADDKHAGVVWGIPHPGPGPLGCPYCIDTLSQGGVGRRA